MAVDLTGPLDGEFRWVLRLPDDRSDRELVTAEFADALDRVSDEGGGRTQLWIPFVDDPAHRLATENGFAGYRDLWQLRAPLPVPGERTTLPVRAFDPDVDLDDFVEVNRRAFAWHPEQGRITVADVKRSMTEPWFSADGFLLHHLDGRLAGFCWTKVHRDTTPELGEIYVIAVDPDFHGRGLGAPMTQVGLDHLADQGLTTAMLYVEADNHAANRVYQQLGFERHHTDRAYRSTL